MQKFFNITIVIFSIILCLLSLGAFLFIHLDLAKRGFQIDLQGINNYFASLTQFKELFAGTITLILAYYGLQRLKTAEKANKNKIKFDRFADWKSITELRMNDLRRKNKIFVREFSRLRYNLYNDIYENNMSINNKAELDSIYDKHFKSITRVFEENDENYKNRNGIYPNDNYTYFFDDFYFVLIGCLDTFYFDIYNDIREKYITSLNQNRTIGKELYNRAFTQSTLLR